MGEIYLQKDKDGNYLVDLVGLLYLVHRNLVESGTPVYMIEDKQVTEYFILEEKVGRAGGGFSIVLNEEGMDQEDLYYLEINSYSLAAKYFLLGEDVHEEIPEEPAIYTKIHYEEAMMRMTKGETVFLDRKKSKIPFTSGSLLEPHQILQGEWFRKEQPVPAKRTPLKQEPVPFTDKGVRDRDALLRDFLGMSEKEFWKMKQELEEEEEELFEVDEEYEEYIGSLSLKECQNVMRFLFQEGVLQLDDEEGDEDDWDWFFDDWE